MLTEIADFKKIVEMTLLSLHSADHHSINSPTVTNAPVVNLVNQIIINAIEMNASDIHIEPVNNIIRIRIRIDGVLQELCEPLPIKLLSFIVSRLKIMSKINSIEYRIPQDGRITFPYHGREIDIRVSTMPLIDGEKIVLRLLNLSHSLLNIDELDFSPENEQMFRSWCHKPYGLILNVGPVNSGKTTTLYAAIAELNSPSRNIVTIEDPVEYHLSGINQIQVNPKVNLTFSNGLRSVLRQDPDIVMLGEIRDEETAEIAIRAALTGHLFFTTLHTGDAVGAVFRLLDMKVVPYLLAASLIGIMGQRLVRRLCPFCAEKYIVSQNSPDSALLGDTYSPEMEFKRAVGCEKCNNTGYKGRIAIHELLPITDKLRSAILERQDLHSFEKLALDENMHSLLSDGIAKALAGKTTLSEIRRVIYGDYQS